MSTEVIPCEILEASIETALKLLANPAHFKGLRDNVVFVQGRQHMRELYRRKGDVKFPMMAVIFDSGSKNRQSYHGVALARMGLVGEFSTEKNVFYKWHLKPVTVNLIVRYITNDQKDALSFFKDWIFKDRHLNFDLVYDNSDFKVGIRAEINDDLSIPELEDAESGELITVETSLILHTYVGEIRSVPRISETGRIAINIPFQGDVNFTVTNVTFREDDNG